MVRGEPAALPGARLLALVASIASSLALGPSSASGEELGRDVPDVPARLPAAFAVMPFENRSGVQGLGWMSAGVPFMVGEKVEDLGGFMPVYGPMVVPPGPVAAATPDAVAGFAAGVGARYVWTGWVSRPNWELQLGVTLWEVAGGTARRIGDVTQTGEFSQVHVFISKAIDELCGKAGISLDAGDRARLGRTPSKDFYAFTLFGRGLSGLLGTEGAIDVERAGKNLTRAVFIEPTMAEGHRIIGEMYAQQARAKPDKAALLKKADAKLSYALSMRPDYAAALSGAATLAIGQGRAARARGFLEDLLRLRPHELEARYRLGKVLWETGDADGAFRELERVVRHRPKDARARRILVLIHSSRGDQRDLIRELEVVAQLDPADRAVKMDLAAAYAVSGRENDAEAAYQALIAADGKNVQAMKFLADLYRRQGKVEKAIAHYEQAIKVAPDDPRSYFQLGEVYVAAGNDKEARKIYQRAQRFKRFLADIYNNLGAISFRGGDLDQALWYHKQAVVKKPRSARFRYNLALTLSSDGRAKEAMVEVDAGLRLEPNHVELRYLRGVVLLRQGDAGAARAEFEKTLALSAEHPGARHNLTLLDELDRRAREGEVVIEGRQ
jgi:Flp pilus assembly protein TadD